MTLLILFGIIALAMWRNNAFFYLMACPLGIVYGLTMADDATNGSYQWVAGITLAIIGTACLFKVVGMSIESARSKR